MLLYRAGFSKTTFVHPLKFKKLESAIKQWKIELYNWKNTDSQNETKTRHKHLHASAMIIMLEKNFCQVLCIFIMTFV